MVMIPYVNDTRSKMELPSDFPLLQFLMCLAAHRCQAFLQCLEANHIRAVFIPAGCTGELQPLDISVNDVFKKKLKLCFSHWYANEVSTALSNGVGVEGQS